MLSQTIPTRRSTSQSHSELVRKMLNEDLEKERKLKDATRHNKRHNGTGVKEHKRYKPAHPVSRVLNFVKQIESLTYSPIIFIALLRLSSFSTTICPNPITKLTINEAKNQMGPLFPITTN